MDSNVILDSFLDTMNSYSNHKDYPKKQGLYCFMLAISSDLHQFGEDCDIIYVGISKQNLNSRDIKTHFNSKRTGASTLRRSLGAILKVDFNLTAYPRSKKRTKQDIYCYKFNAAGEDKLTEWMLNNLLVGYCAFTNRIEYEFLRNYEEDIFKILHPSLDLDRRTRQLNVYYPELDRLRKICRTEARRHYYNNYFFL